jgi:hypothetical protein
MDRSLGPKGDKTKSRTLVRHAYGCHSMSTFCYTIAVSGTVGQRALISLRNLKDIHSIKSTQRIRRSLDRMVLRNWVHARIRSRWHKDSVVLRSVVLKRRELIGQYHRLI